MTSPRNLYIVALLRRRRLRQTAEARLREDVYDEGEVHFEGSHKLESDAESLWNLLNDPDVLARCTPGVKQLKPLAGDRYEAVFDIKLGPINSGFDGTLEIVDKEAPQRFRLIVNVAGKIGTVAAEGSFDLEAENDATIVSFVGDGQLTGVLARMGQRVVSGVARLYTNQFFKALESEIS